MGREARTGWWRDDTKNNSADISFRRIFNAPRNPRYRWQDFGLRSFVNARCNGEPLAVHPVRAWDEGAIYTTRAPTHSAVKTLSTGENRLAQNRLPNSLLPSLCPAVQRCAPAARSHNTLSPPPSLAHLSTLRALCLAQLDLAIPLLPLSLSPRAREILFGALFSTRRSRFSLPRWLTGSARVNWHRAMSDTVDASVDGRGWLGEYFWD